jgi:hypothetical protein
MHPAIELHPPIIFGGCESISLTLGEGNWLHKSKTSLWQAIYSPTIRGVGGFALPWGGRASGIKL